MRITEPVWEEMTMHLQALTTPLQALFPLAYKEFTSIVGESPATDVRRMDGRQAQW